MPSCASTASVSTIIMNKNDKIYVAGHGGLVGSALLSQLTSQGYSNLLFHTRQELDLLDAHATSVFFAREKPDYVFLAAAKVGGIHANNTYPAQFIHENLTIQGNIIHSAYQHGVKRLLFLGSSCIYPKLAPQPMKESCLLTGALEPSNRPYAIAKIAGIETCWSYNRQYGTRYLAVMPTNLYGPGDNYHAENSHVIPGLVRKFCEAKLRNDPEVVVWGTGTPRREFMHSSDMASACLFVMNLHDKKFDSLLGEHSLDAVEINPPLLNIGVGTDITIKELAALLKEVSGFSGKVLYDLSKPDGAPRKLLDISKIEKLGWKAKIPLREGLAQAVEQFMASEKNKECRTATA
jgi:GDP-L-fucose synthase